MSWPGTPTSQQSPTVNTPSTRTPPVLSEHSSMADVAEAMGKAFEGLTVHEQAFAAIPSQIASSSKTAATTAVTEAVSSQTTEGVTSFNALTGAIIYFPNLGYVNNQLGVSSYTALQSDSGKKIIVGDSSAVAIYLDSSLSAPWFAIIDNDSSAVAYLMPDSSLTLYGQNAIQPGGFGIVAFDGLEFWSSSSTMSKSITADSGAYLTSYDSRTGLFGESFLPVSSDSSLGIVQPDGTTINVDSSGTLHVPISLDSSFGIARPDNATIHVDSGIYSTIGATGTITLAPLTDSGATGQITVQNGLIMNFTHPT